MKEFNISPYELSDKVQDFSFATVYDWMKDKCYPGLKNLIDLANIFECSIEYLIGRSEDIGNINYIQPPSWDVQLRKILKEKNISFYKLSKDKIVSAGTIGGWLYHKKDIGLKNLIKLADYLQVDIDTLVGRV